MEFGLLGPLEVRQGERVVPVGGAKQRALLAILLLHANEAVSRDRLLEELWPERPRDAGHSLDHQVSRLRKTLGDPELIVTRPAGYLLRVEPERLDARRFERLLEDGRRANAEGDHSAALARLEQALALWRGSALADLAYEPFARLEVERLEELRLVATEERIDADLALGRHAPLVAELEALAARYPLRERIRAQLMLALYRAGRQADALRVYSETRRRLAEDLGLEPGETLRQLEQEILRQDASLKPPAAASREPARRRKLLLAAAALALAAGAAAGGVVLASGGTRESRAAGLAQPDSVALLAASSGKVVASAPAHGPVLSAFGEGALWNVSFDGELTRIDPASGRASASIGLGVLHPGGIVVGEGSVWVTDCCSPTLVRIDPRLSPPVVADRIRLPTANVQPVDATGEVAVGAGSVWVAHGHLNPWSWVERLDPGTGRVQHRILIHGGADYLSFGDGALWVVGASPGYLTKIDPRTNRVTATVRSLHGYMCCVAVGGGFVWAAIVPDQAVWKIGADGRIVTSIKVGGGIENLSYGDGAVWASDGEAGTVVRIDATTNEVRRYRLGHHLLGVAVRGDLVAVGVQQSAADVTSGLRGAVLRVALKENDLVPADPLFTPWWQPLKNQFQHATCANLYTYPDVPGPAGRELVPEVAAGPPAVTDAGRTYTIRVRKGYRFSPPSNEHVTAATFRHVIERALSPKLADDIFVARPFSDIAGAEAFRTGKTAHVAGVSVHGDALVIRLVRRAPDFTRRLATTAFCAVPLDTPAVPGGLDARIPAAGPYYFADEAGNAIVLRRNPNYHGPRPHRLDAIVFESGIDAGKAATLVAAGRMDYLAENDPVLAPGSAAARAAGARYRLVPTGSTHFLAFNTSRPPFSDLRLRHAVAYALDRAALAPGAGLVPATRLLSPRLPGFDATPLYPLRADLRAARRLMRGRRLHAVFATFDPGIDQGAADFANAVRAQLAAIGVRVTLLELTFADNDDPRKRADDFARSDLVGWFANASDHASDSTLYLQSLPYLPRRDATRLGRIAELAAPERDRQAATVARTLEREGIYAVYAYDAVAEIVSPRLGCVVHQPEYPGVDLAVLCLR